MGIGLTILQLCIILTMKQGYIDMTKSEDIETFLQLHLPSYVRPTSVKYRQNRRGRGKKKKKHQKEKMKTDQQTDYVDGRNKKEKKLLSRTGSNGGGNIPRQRNYSRSLSGNQSEKDEDEQQHGKVIVQKSSEVEEARL